MQDIFIIDKIVENDDWIGCTVRNVNTGEEMKVKKPDIIQAYHQKRLINAVVVNNSYIRTKVGYDTIPEKESNKKSIILYHASTMEVRKPQWDYSQNSSSALESITSDFGVGFYMSEDIEQPIKLVCSRGKVVLNKYEVDLTGLKVKTFGLDDEWLLTVAFHRRNFKKQKNLHQLRDYYRGELEKYDVIVGPIADDRMFTTIQAFITSTLTDVVTIKSMDIMGYSNQYTFKSDKGCSRIKFLGSKELNEEEIEKYQRIVDTERESMEERLGDIRTEYFREGKLFREILNEKRGVF